MTVKDSGIGIQEQKQKEIFDIFNSLLSDPKFNEMT